LHVPGDSTGEQRDDQQALRNRKPISAAKREIGAMQRRDPECPGDLYPAVTVWGTERWSKASTDSSICWVSGA
jgi:hypothetical protein